MINHVAHPALHLYLGATSGIRFMRSMVARFRHAAPVSILFYHRVADNRLTPWTITRADFEAHVAWLRKHFELVELPEAQRRIVEGSDRPAVHLTFDDGYEENDQWAMPWLLDQQIPVTYYVTSDYVSSDRFFPHDIALGLELQANRLETLRRWQGGSVKFGAHTRTHVDLGSCTQVEELIDEIVVGAARLGALLNEPLLDFAFPFGQPRNLHPWSFEICRRAGFRSVASAYGERNHRGSNPFHLRRLHGDPLLARIRNWLTGDPREWLSRRYEVPEFALPEGTIVPDLRELTQRLKTQPEFTHPHSSCC